jgi:hypothetical protein
MSKVKVHIDGHWVDVEPRQIKADGYHFLHNESVEKLKKRIIENRIDAYAGDKVAAAFLKPFPGTGRSTVSATYADRFEYDLQDGNVYLKDYDGIAADESGRVTMERYFDRKPELLDPMKSHR